MSWHLLYPEGRPPTDRVAEVQGLYGAYSFSEKLLQKIWLRGDFDRAALVLPDGRRLRVRHPGKWNLLGGPDFDKASAKAMPAPNAWFGRKVAWFDAEKLQGARVGVIAAR